MPRNFLNFFFFLNLNRLTVQKSVPCWKWLKIFKYIYQYFVLLTILWRDDPPPPKFNHINTYCVRLPKTITKIFIPKGRKKAAKLTIIVQRGQIILDIMDYIWGGRECKYTNNILGTDRLVHLLSKQSHKGTRDSQNSKYYTNLFFFYLNITLEMACEIC